MDGTGAGIVDRRVWCGFDRLSPPLAAVIYTAQRVIFLIVVPMLFSICSIS